MVLDPVIDLGRDICGDLAAAEAREWLVTNGIGGFACGTLAGTLTRRYHGLLVAALPPPSNAITVPCCSRAMPLTRSSRSSLPTGLWQSALR